MEDRFSVESPANLGGAPAEKRADSGCGSQAVASVSRAEGSANSAGINSVSAMSPGVCDGSDGVELGALCYADKDADAEEALVRTRGVIANSVRKLRIKGRGGEKTFRGERMRQNRAQRVLQSSLDAGKNRAATDGYERRATERYNSYKYGEAETVSATTTLRNRRRNSLARTVAAVARAGNSAKSLGSCGRSFFFLYWSYFSVKHSCRKSSSTVTLHL